MSYDKSDYCVGVLALQGAFREHLQLLQVAFNELRSTKSSHVTHWTCREIRTPDALALCDALIIPGGESTTMALVAEQSGLLQPLRRFVKSEFSIMNVRGTHANE